MATRGVHAFIPADLVWLNHDNANRLVQDLRRGANENARSELALRAGAGHFSNSPDLHCRPDVLLVLGFAPTIENIRQRFGEALPIRLMTGGLRPGTTKPLVEAGRRTIRENWEHVPGASGQPFDFRFFEREGFIYDTERPPRP